MRLYLTLASAQVSLIQLRHPETARSEGLQFHSNSEGAIASVWENLSYPLKAQALGLSQMQDDDYFRLAALGPRDSIEAPVVRTSQRLDSQSELAGESSAKREACPVPNDEPLLNDLSLSKGPHVAKTVFDGPRVVFLAGLEGTGHHFYQQSLDLASTGLEPAVLDLFSTRKQSICGPTGSLGEDCGPAQESDDFIPKRDSLVEKFKALHSQGSTKVYGLFHRRPGSQPVISTAPYSYPYCRDAGKAILTHPDIRVLAEVAEMAEIDFRVVVLTRSARAMLHSTAIHRGFCGGGPSGIERQGNYLIHNANVLSTQLSRIDDDFVICSQFEQLPDVSEEFADLYDTALGQPSGYTQKVLSETFDDSALTHEISFTAEQEEIANKVQQSANAIVKAAKC